MFIRIIGLLVLSLSLAPVQAAIAVQPPGTYTVKLTIIRNGDLIAAPTLKLGSGKTATINLAGNTIAASVQPVAADPRHQGRLAVQFTPEKASPIAFDIIAKMEHATGMTFENDDGLTHITARISKP